VAESQFDSLMILAGRDAAALQVLMEHSGLHSVAYFHAQQAIEKAFKAVLSAKGVSYPLTHNLLVLKKGLSEVGVTCLVPDDVLGAIMPFGVEARYDEEIETSLPLDFTLQTVNSLLDWAMAYRP
jgi:HEPN domain-containing protein